MGEQCEVVIEVPAVTTEEVVHECLAVLGDRPVVEHVGGVAPERLRLRSEARRRVRLVFGERARREHAVRLREHQLVEPRQLRRRRLRHDRLFRLGVGHAARPLVDRQVRERLVGAAVHERVQRAEAAQQPLPVRTDLRHHARTGRVLALESLELAAPRAVAGSAERQGHDETRLA
jgi:hypothetical protein